MSGKEINSKLFDVSTKIKVVRLLALSLIFWMRSSMILTIFSMTHDLAQGAPARKAADDGSQAIIQAILLLKAVRNPLETPQ